MFQTMINNISSNLIVENIMIVYLNDIFIFTRTLKYHYKIVYRVFKVLAVLRGWAEGGQNSLWTNIHNQL